MLNCKPGDLARIVGTHPFVQCTDRVVRLKKEPPYYIGCDAYWHLEEPMVLVASEDFLDARCKPFRAGQSCVCDSMADEHLRPIRGGDISDEEVRELYAPSAGEVSHG